MNPLKIILTAMLACALVTLAHADDETSMAPPAASPPIAVIDLPELSAVEILEQAEHWMDRGLELASENRDDSAAAFSQAATRYQSLITQHGARNAPVLRAMGVAKLHAGDIPGSIVSLRAAAVLDPTDTRTRESLTAARAQVEAAPEIALRSRAEQWVGIWRGWIPRSALLISGLALLALAWFIGAANIAWGTPRRLWIAVSFLAASFPLGLLGFELWRAQSAQHVVLAQEAVGRGGPSSDVYHPTFEDPLPAGLEALAIDHRSGWTEIKLASGEQTWVRNSTLIGVEDLLYSRTP